MPKIALIRRPISGENIEMQIFYDSRKKHFTVKDIPEKVEKLSGQIVEADTEKQIVENLDALLKKYHTEAESIRKVILWKFKVLKGTSTTQKWETKTLFGEPKTELIRENNGLFSEKFTERWNGGEHGYELSYVVVFRKEAEKITFHTINKDLEGNEIPGYGSDGYREWGQIEYTQEREDFFVSVSEATRQVAKRIANFLDATPDELVFKIASLQKQQLILTT